MPSLGPCCRKMSCPNNLPPNSGISNLNSLGPKPWPTSLSGKAPSSTDTLCARPSRQKVNCTVRPPGVSRISRRNWSVPSRSEEHTSELQSRLHLVCRLLLEKKKKRTCQQTCEYNR